MIIYHIANEKYGFKHCGKSDNLWVSSLGNYPNPINRIDSHYCSNEDRESKWSSVINRISLGDNQVLIN